MNHEYFMEKAIELSLDNMRSGKGGPFWAIIVKDGKIVGSGANHVTSDNDPTAHAEVVANTRVDAANIGFDDDFIYEEIKKDLTIRSLPIEQVGRANALKVFEERKKKSDKIEY